MGETLQNIAPDHLTLSPHRLLNSQWMLVATGDFRMGRWNAMTIAWGSFGTMWGLPFAQIVLRPQRYTRELMETHESFTLSAYPTAYRAALETMGSRSGRQGNKAAAAGLTPAAAEVVAAPVFKEAELILECRKIFAQDMAPEALLDRRAKACYAAGDYHRMYFGEIVAARGIAKYAAQ